MADSDKGGINVILALLAVAGVLYWMDRRQKDLLTTLQAGGRAALPGPGPIVPPEAVHPGTVSVEVSEESIAIDPAPAPVLSYAPRLVTCTNLLPRHFYSERSTVYHKEIIKLNKAIGRMHRVARMASFTAAGARHHQAKLIALQRKRDQLAACAGTLRVKPVPRVVSRGRIHRHPPHWVIAQRQALIAQRAKLAQQRAKLAHQAKLDAYAQDKLEHQKIDQQQAKAALIASVLEQQQVNA